MKQEINTTHPALSPSLEKVRDRFETWRKRKKPGSRIPKALWQAAVESCKDDSVLQVSRALRLNSLIKRDALTDNHDWTRRYTQDLVGTAAQ